MGVRCRGPCPIYFKEGKGGKGGASEIPNTEVCPDLQSEGSVTPDMAGTAVSPAVGFGSVGSMRFAYKCDPTESGRKVRQLSNKCTPSSSMMILCRP